MGIFSKIKGWFTAGGVSVDILQTKNPFPKEHSVMDGTFAISTPAEKVLLGNTIRFYQETTIIEQDDEGNNKKRTKEITIGETSESNLEFPLTLKAGDNIEASFTIQNVHFETAFKDRGGLLGAIGKAADFLDDDPEFVKYYLKVEVDVKGTPFDPSNKIEMMVIEGSE